MYTNDLEGTGEEDSAHRKQRDIGGVQVPVQGRGWKVCPYSGLRRSYSEMKLFQEGKTNIPEELSEPR